MIGHKSLQCLFFRIMLGTRVWVGGRGAAAYAVLHQQWNFSLQVRQMEEVGPPVCVSETFLATFMRNGETQRKSSETTKKHAIFIEQQKLN